jgi:membrane-associated phospholipid phosphatase
MPAFVAAAFLLATVAPVPSAATTTAAPPPAPRVEWSPEWKRFRAWEYVGTAGVQAASIYVRWYRPPPQQARFTGDNVFDDTVRGWLRADTPESRQLAGRISDRISYAGTAVPFAIDLPVALLVHRQVGVTWQLLMMDLEATAVANFVNNMLFYEVGRGRPSTRDCAIDPSYDPICGGTGNNASLPSGHTVTIATAAGLTCVHHRYLPLYGDRAADTGACVLVSLATLATGAMRVTADRHYTTDVLLGAAIGFGSGYGLPWLLHYRPSARAAEARDAKVALLPFFGRGELGLGVAGAL